MSSFAHASEANSASILFEKTIAREPLVLVQPKLFTIHIASAIEQLDVPLRRHA